MKGFLSFFNVQLKLELINISVAHRDIKSSNVLLRSSDHALISDFGLAIALNVNKNPHDENRELVITHKKMILGDSGQ